MLIVDDEATLRTVLGAMYTDAGFEVRTCGSAEEALVDLAAKPCDVLVVDKNLPAMNGIDLARQVLGLGAAQHAVMITGYPSTTSLIEAINVGIRGYLMKPFRTLDDAIKEAHFVVDNPPRRTRLGPVALRAHLDASSPLDPAPSAVVVVSDVKVRDQFTRHLGGPIRTFGSVEFGLAALYDRPPDVVAADSVVDLLRMIERAPAACGCYVGASPGFEDALRLMRAGPMLVAEPEQLREGKRGT